MTNNNPCGCSHCSDEERKIKNIETRKLFILKDLLNYKASKVASLTLVQRPEVGITILAIAENEGLSTHSAPGEAFVTILEGKAKIMIEKTEYTVSSGESLIMPSNKPHSVKAITDMKMMLILIK